MNQKEELLAFFFVEVNEQIELLEQAILQLEQDKEDKEIIQNIFRYAHSIKGSSASMGFLKLKELTHEMEYILDLIRKEKLEATPAVVNTLFACLDVLRQLKEDYENENEPNDITEMIQHLQALSAAESTTSIASSAKKQPVLEPAVTAALEKEQNVWVFTVTFNEGAQTRMIRSHIIKKEVEKAGPVLFMDVSEVENESSRKVLFFIVKEQDILDDVVAQISKIIDIHAVSYERVARIDKEKQKPKNVKKAAPQTIRVDVHKIEDLMNLVGEILIDQTMVSQMNQEFKKLFDAHEEISEQERILKHMARVLSEFQENVMKIRMLPIEQLFSRIPRIVRDLSGQLDKEVELLMEGGETELDRTVIEELNDPMVHIIRNSLDHGIESAEVRKAAGKSEKGTVRVHATQKENQVVLTIEDDGAGIDPDKVKDSAIKKGIITLQQAEKMTEKDIIHLIFAPGFSTAAVVSDVSGRGVGTDVVRTHIEKLNGMIEVESKKGFGTKMIIKLPLTLAILKAFLIDINKRTFAIPMNSVTEIFKIKKEAIQSINGQKIVKIREASIPLYFGNDVLHLEEQNQEKKEFVVMLIGIAEKRIGLIVDRLIGNQEIVIKSLGSYVGKLPAISGATIMGDGQVALILDAASIFKLISETKGESNFDK